MVLMGHMVRAGPWNPKGFNTGPSLYVHCDATMDRTIDLLKSVCGAESEELLKKRWAQVNVCSTRFSIKTKAFSTNEPFCNRFGARSRRSKKHPLLSWTIHRSEKKT